ncbi:non-specific serine threonine protein kinase [Ligilactobacillus equi DSM 15833 = JCM 10991]|uniref:non-specific serine/threonine protein kinase n=2 Tax=Ligilactobacillus equi TaxID=137357 RepID=A0A0R1TGF4_9LACO|nr:Stk1 family PASTA domain-containing Ser/Thr kinase [Ligilactobacillus equi]KRL79710.1 non-specific serine threonine protein kinase [Ligilactobacillus equi DSM 15833 = JCM 10991]
MRAGQIIDGRYQILRTLGEGGMATVYLAEDRYLKRQVAIKFLRLDLRDDEVASRRFYREAQALTELSNPHVVEIYDVGEVSGTQYLVMEYVKGSNLKEYIRQNAPLAYTKVQAIMLQILAAVMEAHRHGIVHRDLKPQNILLDENEKVKITDFGIAMAVADETLTRTNTVLGSVHYISPEQARGSLITKQSDIYSLGIIMYELLTGEVPYQGETAVSIALQHFQKQMPYVRERDASIPQALENVILKATAKDVKDRYKDIEEMRADLQTALSVTRLKEPRWYPQDDENDATKVLTNVNDEIKKINQLQKASQFSRRKQGQLKKLKVVFAIVVLGLVLGAILIFYPRQVQVPRLQGQTLSKAQSELLQANLKSQVKYRYDDKVAKNKVIKATPKEAKRGQTIVLYVSKGQKARAFGDYLDQDYDMVAKKLQKQGVKVKYKFVYASEYRRGLIMDQTLSPKKKVIPKQTKVTFTVSAGSESTLLKDLTGKTQAQAQAYAKKHGLNLEVAKRASVQKAGKVTAQNPGAATWLQAGSTLRVVVSNGKGSDPEELVDQTTFSFPITINYVENGTGTNEIKIYLEDANHNYKNVYQQFRINKNTTMSITFTLDAGKTGKYKVVRDGRVIAENQKVHQ